MVILTDFGRFRGHREYCASWLRSIGSLAELLDIQSVVFRGQFAVPVFQGKRSEDAWAGLGRGLWAM